MLVVEGKKMFQEAYQSTWKIEAIIVREDWLSKSANSIPFDLSNCLWIANYQEFAQMSSQVQSEGIITVLHFPDATFGISQDSDSIDIQGPAFIFDEIQDPGNVGTIIRTLNWLGITNVICGLGTVDILNSKCLRASMGSVFHLNIYFVHSVEKLLINSNAQVWIADMRGKSINEVSFGKDDWILLGNEANGVSPRLRKLKGINFVSIPGKGKAESLNVGVAAAIIAWELSKLQ